MIKKIKEWWRNLTTSKPIIDGNYQYHAAICYKAITRKGL